MKITNLIYRYINIIAIVIISIILITNMIIIGYFPNSNELVAYKINNILVIAFLLFLIALFYFVCKKAKISTKKILVIMLLFQIVLSFFWINTAKTIPQFDQANINDIAKIFIKNENLAQYKDYITKNPHQIGIVSYIQFIYSVFQTTDYRIIQYINILWIVIITFTLYKITNICYKNEILNKAVILICGLFLQLVFLSTFIYGDIIRIITSIIILILFIFIYQTR